MKSKTAQKCPEGNTGTSGQKSRLQCFTSFYEHPPTWNKDKMKFLAYGKETCPTTGKQHWQGFVYWFDGKSHKAAGKLLNNAHVETCKGSWEDNEKYCSKEGHYTTHGTPPQQGRRNDLEEICADINAGALTSEEVALTNPYMYHQYGRTLEKLEDIAARKIMRTEMTKGIWYWGPTGVGKSHKAFEGFNPETHYVYRHDNGWWEGYKGQETVIINDFRGEIKFNELLAIVDKWPMYVKRRGREPVPFISKVVIITTSLEPEKVYKNLGYSDSIEQLLRRFDVKELTDSDAPKDASS